jgi:hypothetical protein
MPRALLDVEPALLDALFTLLVAERERAVHAQQNFDYKGSITWTDGLNPYVNDPDRPMHIPEKWDGALVVLGYGMAYINDAGTMELECLPDYFALCQREGSQDMVFSPECSYNALGNKRSKPGGLAKGLHGGPGAENEKRFLKNNLEFVKTGGKLIMLTSAVKAEPSTV